MASDLQWGIWNRLVTAHVALYRATGGRLGARIPRGSGQMLLLDHVGRRSGKKRTIVLLYVADGENLVLVASKGGSHTHPAWFLNLMASPETTVQVGSRRRRGNAREAKQRERKRLWPRLDDVWPRYEGYRERSRREIPLVILEPVG